MPNNLDMQEMAQEYGWSLAVLNSNPELKRIFQRAVDNEWSPNRFVASVRDTNWFKKNGEAARKAAILKKSDPAEYKRRINQMDAQVRTLVGDMIGGGKVGGKRVRQLSTAAVTMGWTENELKLHIGRTTQYQRLMNKGILGGEAGQLEEQARKWAKEYGVKVSNKWIADRVRNSMIGRNDPQRILNRLQQMAKNRYPLFAKNIDSGQTVADMAEDYMQTMSQVLELPQGRVSVFDKHIQKALTHTNDDGKPIGTPMWEFERQLKNDSRWMRTKNAEEEIMSVGRGLLERFGQVAL